MFIKVYRYVDLFYKQAAVQTVEQMMSDSLSSETPPQPGQPELPSSAQPGQPAQPLPAGQFSDNPMRQRICEIALSQVGKGGGGEYSKLYLIPGDTVPDNYQMTGNPVIKTQQGGGYVYWCGIFVLWCYHRAGILTGLKWNFDGTGFVKAAGLEVTQNPKPGDLGYIPAFNHHNIVLEEKNGQIDSINGNAGNNSSDPNDPTKQKKFEPGGIVSREKIAKSKFSGFYSIAKLVGE